MSKGESGHLHTAKNCRKFISGTLGGRGWGGKTDKIVNRFLQ